MVAATRSEKRISPSSAPAQVDRVTAAEACVDAEGAPQRTLVLRRESERAAQRRRT